MPQPAAGPSRLARDSMGELQVPAGAFYGANSQRAKLNFPISDLKFNRSFIKALGQIKQSASRVNRTLTCSIPYLVRP